MLMPSVQQDSLEFNGKNSKEFNEKNPTRTTGVINGKIVPKIAC